MYNSDENRYPPTVAQFVIARFDELQNIPQNDEWLFRNVDIDQSTFRKLIDKGLIESVGRTSSKTKIWVTTETFDGAIERYSNRRQDDS